MSRCILAVLLLFPAIVFATHTSQNQAAPPARPNIFQPEPMTVEPIGGGLYFAKAGTGANSVFYVGNKSVTVIDVKMTAESARELQDKIAKVTDKPVATIILTHSDLDHVNGLIGFPRGLTIIASENTKKEMVEAFADEKMAEYRPYLPNRTFTGTMTFDAGGEVLTLRQLGPAHTSGDVIVVFPKEKTAAVGDLVFIGRDLLIHRPKGGSAFGYLAALKTMIGLEDVETYLSGHADAATKADLQGVLSTFEEKAAKVKALFASGKSLEEIKAALLPPPPPDAPASRWPSFVENVYLELAEKK